MKRRILSLILIALLLLPSALTSAATTPVTITSDDVRGSVGDIVSTTLNIVIDPPKLGQTMDSLQFVLEYDSAALEFVSIQEVSQDRINILGARYTCNVTTGTGAVAFSASATDGATGSGLLMHVRFRVLSAFSTMLVLKKVSYSFVTPSTASQRTYTGGTMNLGRITGQSAPTTVAPASYEPTGSPDPMSTDAAPTEQPRFPVTETTLAPGASPSAQPTEEGDSDTLAYIVFGLFIVVAILICVVLTLMIVRRGKNKAQMEMFAEEDEEGEEPYEQIEYYEDDGYAEDYEQPRPKKRQSSGKKKPRPDRYEEDEEDEPPIQIVRRGKK